MADRTEEERANEDPDVFDEGDGKLKFSFDYPIKRI